MIVPNCEGCEYEFYEALETQKQGYHFATSLDQEYEDHAHFYIWMVDDEGNIVYS
jgi:hypothetical protein